MGQSSGIDRFYDGIDKIVDTATNVLNRTSKVADPERVRAAERVTAEPSMAMAKPARVRVIESMDGESGESVWIVTDGSQRAECNSAPLAAKIKRAMEMP